MDDDMASPGAASPVTKKPARIQARTVDGLLSRIKKVRMLKLIVWHSMIFLDMLYIAAFVAACAVVQASDKADLISDIMKYAAGTHGGELLLTAALRLWGKEGT
jgi:hypothetical protein